MPYSTLEDLKKLIPNTMLINLSNDDAGALRVKQTVIDEAINQADREIDSYVGVVKQVPLNPVPELVANLSAKMAIWNLHLRKFFDNPVWSRTYEQCQDLLKLISQGKLSLDPVNESTPSAAPNDHGIVTEDEKFTSTYWSEF